MQSELLEMAGYLLTILELSAAGALFFRRLPRRKFWPLRLALFGCAAAALSYLLSVLWDVLLSAADASSLSPSLFLPAALVTLLFQLLLFFFFQEELLGILNIRPYTAVSVGCTAVAIQSISRCLFTLCAAAWDIPELFSPAMLARPGWFGAYLLLFLLVCLVCYVLFIRGSNPEEETLYNRRLQILLVTLVVLNLFLGCVPEPHESAHATHLYQFLLVGRVLVCIITLVMQYTSTQWVRQQAQEEQLNRILQEQAEQYEFSRESMDAVNRNAHDLRHQLDLILNAVRQTGDAGRLTEELNQMARQIGTVDDVFRTGNPALDVVLTEKARICTGRSIQFSAIADGSAVGFLGDVELYTLFGNALDNAIEAVSQIPRPEERIISLSVRREREMVCIHAENTCQTPPVFRDGLPQTSKPDRRIHGYGIRSMVSIARKYGGTVKTGLQNGGFCLDILLPSAPV